MNTNSRRSKRSFIAGTGAIPDDIKRRVAAFAEAKIDKAGLGRT